jgi:hypothetical protein
MEQEQQRVSPHRNTSGKPQAGTQLSALQPPRIAAKSYHGRRGRNGTEVWVEEFCPSGKPRREQTIVRPLPLQFELRNHSPTGFAWGYCGSAPAQLALALLMDATGEPTLALRHYQEFKFRFVAGWREEWRITETEIRSFVAAQENLAGCRPA